MGWFWNGKCKSKARLDGKTVVITGCNTGIGKYTVLDLYARGARVVMACRNVEKAEEARDWVIEQRSGQQGLGQLSVCHLDLSSLSSVRKCADKILLEESHIHILINNAGVMMCPRSLTEEARDWVIEQRSGQQGLGQLSVCHLDLSSLSSVRKCADKILDEETHIDILINNAGVMMCPRSLTEDGYELQFATNHLGHFLFTLVLLPKIVSSVPSKIINVSSEAHKWCKSLCLDDINLEKSYNPQQSYFRSKLANLLFSRELTKRLKDTEVNVYSVHPGAVDTDLPRHLVSGPWKVFRFFANWFLKTPEQGAQTTIYCAVDEKAANETGLYYSDCAVATTTAMAQDDELAKRLWDTSLDMVKLTLPHPFGKSTI
uniref:Uncharacterized protein n=1 Tax=Homalodisca liturata TaxID=320908 RepID=A0A1B6HUV6_9HEMI